LRTFFAETFDLRWSPRLPAATAVCLVFGVDASRGRGRFDEMLAATRSHAYEFVGLSEPQARALAEKLVYQLRVRSKDEPITADWSARRVTADLSTGVVTGARAG
jgi:hypothetical protein